MAKVPTFDSKNTEVVEVNTILVEMKIKSLTL